MTTHPPAHELAQFARGTLPADALLRVDDHLACCDACRAHAASLFGVDAALPRVRTMFDPRHEHGLPMVAPASRWRWAAYAAAGAAAAGFAGWVALSGIPRPSIDGDATVAGAAGATPPGAPAAPPATVVATLNDGGRTVTMDVQGSLGGIAEADPADREAVAAALRTGALPLPPVVRDLRRRPGTLMAAPVRPGELRLRHPIGTAVESGRPVFEWTSVGSRASYIVSVFTDDLEKVAESAPLSDTRWSPPRPLPPGRTYVWQVRARAGTRNILEPRPPAPEARFRRLDEEEAQRVAALRARYANSPLALAVVFARAGLLDEASMSLQTLAAANPGSTEVDRLIASLTGRPRAR